MEELSIASQRLKTARDDHERSFQAQMAALDEEEAAVNARLAELNGKRHDPDRANFDARDDDVVEVNAGGKIVSARRSALTQLGGRLEALFGGRWDRALQRDGRGRVFLDVDPACFQAIVDHLNEMAISSEDSPPSPPSVGDEHKDVLRRHLELFGLRTTEIPDSNIVKTVKDVDRLHDWLEEDGSDGELVLLYRGSRDGLSSASFHSKCDNQGRTLTIIETSDGFILGGYSNTPWTGSNCYRAANKAFLFVLSGSDISSPYKLKLKNVDNAQAVYDYSSYGPAFGNGHDLYTSGSNVSVRFGFAYESGPSGKLTPPNNVNYATFNIKEMEVFQVNGASSRAVIATGAKQARHQVPQVEPVSVFSESVNKAISAKKEALLNAESEMTRLEKGFEDETNFVAAFASGDATDIVTLNVSGTTMSTKRSTLQAVETSVLARQFDDSVWTEQARGASRAKEWTPEEVAAWAENVYGIPEDVVGILKENGITGCELLALKKEGLTMLGITRTGTLCLLLEEIKKLERASQERTTFVEHSPYCFDKILNYLRLKQLYSQGLVEEPDLPKVCDSQKTRFEKVVRYYFPGNSAKFILA